jgi:hypothetical protein
MAFLGNGLTKDLVDCHAKGLLLGHAIGGVHDSEVLKYRRVTLK